MKEFQIGWQLAAHMLLASLTLGGVPVAAQTHSPTDKSCIAAIENKVAPFVIFNGQLPPQRTLADRMAFYHVPGISIAVIHNGEIAWAHGYGVARTGGPPVTPDTLFQAGSVSKPVLAMAVLHLVQTGKLTLDTDVNRYLTTWKVPENRFTAQKKVTLRELLAHTAGMTNRINSHDLASAGDPVPTLAQILNGENPAGNSPVTVTRTPGTAWMYSNDGYNVMAQLLQDVNGKPFPTLMQDLVLGPIGMSNSSYEQPLPSALKTQTALPFDENGLPIKAGPYTIPEGAGGLWSTPSDLARFALDIQASLAGKAQHVLTPTTSREMIRPQVRPSWLLGSNAGDYGLGLEIEGSIQHPYFQHDGYVPGFNTLLVAFHSGDGAVIMTNADNGDQLGLEVLHTIAHEYHWPDFYTVAHEHRWPDFQIADHKTASLDPREIDRFVGHYQIGQYITVNITRDGSHLMFGEQKLFPVSERTWFDSTYGSRFTFDQDASGRVIGLTLPLLHVVETSAKRLTEAEWQLCKNKRAAKLTSQAQDPGTEAALRRFIGQMQRGQPNYAQLTPGLADAIRQNLPNIKAGLAPFGSLHSLTFTGVNRGCDDLYTAEFDNGPLTFSISVMPDGTLWRIWLE